MRQEGKTLADLHYYIPKNKADYDAIQARKAAEREAAAKAAAARRANADLRNTPVYDTQGDDGMMFNDSDLDNDSGIGIDAAASTDPSKTGYSSSSTSSSQTERVPQSQDSIGIFYDQNGKAMTIQEVRAYAARHNITLQ